MELAETTQLRRKNYREVQLDGYLSSKEFSNRARLFYQQKNFILKWNITERRHQYIALRLVKDFERNTGGTTKLSITLPMIKSVEEAYNRYSASFPSQNCKKKIENLILVN